MCRQGKKPNNDESKEDQDDVIFSRHVDMMNINDTVTFEWNINKKLLNEFK